VVSSASGTKVQLVKMVTCPHCWERFPPEETKWVAVDPSLRGDPRLGSDGQRRFLPVRFDPFCRAIDPAGGLCTELACPRCHLTIPRAALEMPPLFISILGAPGAGKSYFLAAALWRLRRTLKRRFLIDFVDADPKANTIVNEYVNRLFNPVDPTVPVALETTEKDGQLYEGVNYGDGNLVSYPKPFTFVVQPSPEHPSYGAQTTSRLLCLYDNAGEHFLPGEETASSPGTRHLAESAGMIFLFDPLQVAAFRNALRGISHDPQVAAAPWTYQQDRILDEAANRIRVHARLPQHAKIPKPLIVAVTKYDVWKPLFDDFELDLGLVLRRATSRLCGLVTDALADVSSRLRRLLSRLAPEIVSAAESMTDDVRYVPVTALGCSPEEPEATGGPTDRPSRADWSPEGPRRDTKLFVVRPEKLEPRWVELPFIYLMYKAGLALIPACIRRSRRRSKEE